MAAEVLETRILTAFDRLTALGQTDRSWPEACRPARAHYPSIRNQDCAVSDSPCPFPLPVYWGDVRAAIFLPYRTEATGTSECLFPIPTGRYSFGNLASRDRLWKWAGEVHSVLE